jgi:hypothetical protein
MRQPDTDGCRTLVGKRDGKVWEVTEPVRRPPFIPTVIVLADKMPHTLPRDVLQFWPRSPLPVSAGCSLPLPMSAEVGLFAGIIGRPVAEQPHASFPYSQSAAHS